jgi:hypothetical protein
LIPAETLLSCRDIIDAVCPWISVVLRDRIAAEKKILK